MNDAQESPHVFIHSIRIPVTETMLIDMGLLPDNSPPPPPLSRARRLRYWLRNWRATLRWRVTDAWDVLRGAKVASEPDDWDD